MDIEVFGTDKHLEVYLHEGSSTLWIYPRSQEALVALLDFFKLGSKHDIKITDRRFVNEFTKGVAPIDIT